MKLTKVDQQILNSYIYSMEGLAAYLGPGCELILHSLENLEHSVIFIINGYHSNRSKGAPITNMALNMLNKIKNNDIEHRHCTYFNTSPGNVPVKSSTISIIGENDRTIGLLCINFYMDTPVSKIIEAFVPSIQPMESFNETFSSNIDQLLTSVLAEAYQTVRNNPEISSTNRNREIIRYLYYRGIFNIKDAVIQVAKAMGLSKNTVYMHLRNLSE